MNTEDLSSNEDDVEISEDSIQDTTSEEDMFLPQCIPSQIESLPRLLRLSTKRTHQAVDEVFGTKWHQGITGTFIAERSAEQKCCD